MNTDVVMLENDLVLDGARDRGVDNEGAEVELKDVAGDSAGPIVGPARSKGSLPGMRVDGGFLAAQEEGSIDVAAREKRRFTNLPELTLASRRVTLEILDKHLIIPANGRWLDGAVVNASHL